ncbi:MAG: hypothetical protein IH948_09545, partial [Bacteroidetes bacterium]|nr:hypothetical protein [Bacteroidota bacterium]
MFNARCPFLFLFTTSLLLTFQLAEIKAEGLKAFFNYCSFVSPEQGPYIETYLTFAGATARYRKNADSMYVAHIDIDITISKNDSVIQFRRYEIVSPPHTTDVILPPNFLDLQKFLLDTGYYMLEIKMADKNDTARVSSFKTDIKIERSANIHFSDIQLLQDYYPSSSSASHVKNGYAMVPYPLQTAPGRTSFIPENVDSIGFYIELYNTRQVLGDSGRYLITYFLEEAFTHHILKGQINYIRAKSEDVKILLAKLNFSKVYSGNYNLVLRVNDENNKLISTKTIKLQRSKHPAEVNYDNLKDIAINNTFVSKIKDKSTLIEYLRCIQVIASKNENT